MDTITYKEVATGDEAVMFSLFSAVRSEELGMQAWPPQLRDQILRMQFDAQQSGYRSEYPGATTRLIFQDGVAIGWVIVDSGDSALLGIDIALLSEQRSRGIGTRIIQALQSEAAATSRPFRIVVQRTNQRAAALYKRLGFRDAGGDHVYSFMEWRRD